MEIPSNYDLLEELSISSYNFSGRGFSQNTIASLPVLCSRNGRAFVGRFLYDFKLDKKKTFPRPYAWVLTPTDDGEDYMISWCSALDFMDTESYPLDSRVLAVYNTNEKQTDKQWEQYHKEIKELFLEISEMDFVPLGDLGSTQIEIIERYKELFVELCYTELYPYYYYLSPEFFSWIGLKLVKTKVDKDEGLQQKIITGIENLSKQFKNKLATDRKKDELFDELHGELQRYKTGAYEEISLTTLRDVIIVIDNIGKSLKLVDKESPSPSGYKKLMELFKNIEQDLIDLLYRHGVDPYETEGDKVDIPYQKVLETEETSNPDLDKKVAGRINRGWKKGKLVIRAEYVRAYLYKETKENKEHSTEELPTDE